MNLYEKKFEEKTGMEFNRYYKEFKPKLKYYLTRYTHNIELAEEFADMAFIQGLEKIDTYNSELSQFITWLTSIAVNLVIKDYKDRIKNISISLDHELGENFKVLNTLSYNDNEYENELDKENKVKSEIIKKVINTLPEKYKKVMIMRELDKKPYKEISENIKKTFEYELTYDILNIDNMEDFDSLDVTNVGNEKIKINFHYTKENEMKRVYDLILYPSERKIFNKTDFDIKNDKIEILSDKSVSKVILTNKTNLSTIKSQIKKGRYLIRKKVKKDFDIIDNEGV